jgi:hypothetical protein
VEVQGSVEALPTPPEPGTPVRLRGAGGTGYSLGDGHVVMWLENGTHYAVSAPLSLTETVAIASGLVPMQLEQFEQVMRERE